MPSSASAILQCVNRTRARRPGGCDPQIWIEKEDQQRKCPQSIWMFGLAQGMSGLANDYYAYFGRVMQMQAGPAAETGAAICTDPDILLL